MGDLRDALQAALDEYADKPEKIQTLIAEAFELEKEKRVWHTFTCPECKTTKKQEVTVSVPDFRERAKALEILLNQAKGKPPERVAVTVDLAGRSLEQLSDEELRVLAAGHARPAELTTGTEG